MDPNRYVNEHSRKEDSSGRQAEMPKVPVPPRKPPYNAAAASEDVPLKPKPPVRNGNVQSSAQRRKAERPVKNTGRLCVSGKRFFGQILIDHWVLRINGEQRELPFGQNKLSLELPAGVYLVTAYTPYLGMHCMRVTADIEIRPGSTTNISYQTVFDIFKNGIIRQRPAM